MFHAPAIRSFLTVRLLLLSVFLLSGCSDSSEFKPSGKSINVGVIGDYSGKYRVEGINSLEGVQAAKKSEPFLRNGDELVIVSREEGKTPAETRNIIREFVEEHDISALLLGSVSDSILAVKDTIEEIGVPTIAIVATHADVTSETEFINQLCFTDTQQAQVAALFVRDELLLRKSAVVYDPDRTYSANIAYVFRDKFKSTGGVITGFHKYGEFQDDALKLLAQAGTEMLYLPLDASEIIAIVDRLNEMDWDPALMGTDGLLANVVKRHPGNADDLERMYSTDVIAYQGEFVKVNPLGRKAARTFSSLFGRDADSYNALGVEAYAVLQDAMNRCHSARDKECVRNKIRSTKDFKGVISRLSIGSDGKAVRPVFVNQIKNGKLASVVKVY